MWKSEITGKTGNGEFMDKATAENPDIKHWLESESESEDKE